MTEKVFVITDLGYGDGGKGTIADWLAWKYDSEWVMRTGAAQAFHTVKTSGGQHFTFSQFGSGTLRGAKTFLTKHMLVDPYALLAEGRALQRGLGISNAFDMQYISNNALLITPWHAIANRLKEVARGRNWNGTVGIGVGEAIRHSQNNPEEAVHVSDIGTPKLVEKMHAIRRRYRMELIDIVRVAHHEWSERSDQDIDTLENPEVVEWAADEFAYMTELVHVVSDDFLLEVLSSPVPIICEASQGVLIGPRDGWHPYTTKVDSTSADILGMIKEAGYGDQVTRFGIMRAYQTRHGPGPFVTESADLTRILVDSHNSSDHPWQGSFRVGQLDFPALRYAIEACGGASKFDGLVVTNIDRMKELSCWQVCKSYRSVDLNSNFFMTQDGLITEIKIDNSPDQAHLSYQEALGNQLRTCKPVLSDVQMLPQALLDEIEGQLGLPVVVTSFGPTERDKKTSLTF